MVKLTFHVKVFSVKSALIFIGCLLTVGLNYIENRGFLAFTLTSAFGLCVVRVRSVLGDTVDYIHVQTRHGTDCSIPG